MKTILILALLTLSGCAKTVHHYDWGYCEDACQNSKGVWSVKTFWNQVDPDCKCIDGTLK